ncbi:MAG: putative toxin-antitoxin system toxin component, PIN family [Candidatus Pacearchaeota archaeon]|nr:putative toxin-antitoxin system toxin component, PIN family [Candidatus Pacearchaeota archaeon]
MRIVLDTNVFISGIFWEGNFCSKIVEAWKDKKFELVSSLEIIEELVKTLKSFKIQMDELIIKEWGRLIIENSIIVKPSEKLKIITEDIEDNKFLETALEGKADFIISQDKHLLNVSEFRGIRIILPENFLKIFKREKN